MSCEKYIFQANRYSRKNIVKLLEIIKLIINFLKKRKPLKFSPKEQPTITTKSDTSARNMQNVQVQWKMVWKAIKLATNNNNNNNQVYN